MEFSELGLTGRGEDDLNQSMYQHNKQGQTFMDEANQEVRNLCKQSVGCSELNDDCLDVRSKPSQSIHDGGKSKYSASGNHDGAKQSKGSISMTMNDGVSKNQLSKGQGFTSADTAINQIFMNETTNLIGNSFIVSERKDDPGEIFEGKEASLFGNNPHINMEELGSSSVSMSKYRNLNDRSNRRQSKIEELDSALAWKEQNPHLAVKRQSIESYQSSNVLNVGNNQFPLSLKQPVTKQHNKLISKFTNSCASPIPNQVSDASQKQDIFRIQARKNIDSNEQNIKTRNLASSRTAVFSLKFLISIKPKIKKFITNRTTFGRTRVLSKRVRDFIADEADYNRFQIQQNFFKKLMVNVFHNLEKICKTLRLDKIPLFDPENKIKIALNSIIVTYNCFYMLMITVVLIFDAHMEPGEEHVFTYIAMASWILEMIMEMNTVCYHNNHFVTDRRVIIKIYAKEYFFFEILPLIFEGRTSSDTLINVLLHLPLLLKIKGMMIILKKLEFYILQILEKHYLFQLFKLIMQMLLYGHIVACSWNLVVKVEKNLIGSTAWVDHSEIDSEQWWMRYLMAQYWSFSVMMNVTTIPTTPLELGFTSFIMLFSCIAFGYLLSTVAGIIADISRQQKDYKKDLNTLNSYMKRKKVDLGVKRRVNISLKTFYQQKSKDNLQVEKLALSKLSTEMLHELNCQANSRILKQFPFFTRLFSEQTLTRVYSIMEEEVYAPQQIILRKDAQIPDNQYLYFILKGEVTILVEHFLAPNIFDEESQFLLNSEGLEETHSIAYQENDLLQSDSQQPIVRKTKTTEDPSGPKKIMGKLTSGHIFGAFSFFTGMEGQPIELKCKEFTTLIKIQRSQFINVVMENKKDYEKFCEIRDKMGSEKVIDDMPDQGCLICGSKEHRMKQCGFGCFDKRNLLLFFKHNHSKNQERQPRYANQIHRERKHALQDRNLNLQKMEEFRKNYDFEWYSSLLHNDFEEDFDETDSRQHSFHSHQSDNQQKHLKSVLQIGQVLHLEEEQQQQYAKQLFPSQLNSAPTANFQSPPNNPQPYYPSPDTEVIPKLTEDDSHHNNNNKADDPDDCIAYFEDVNPQFNPSNNNPKSSSIKRGNTSRCAKPHRSLLKMNDSNTMNNSSSNGHNITSSITNIHPSSNITINLPNIGNNIRNRAISDNEQNLLKKRLSFVNVSPKNIHTNESFMHLSANPVYHSSNSFTNAFGPIEENHHKKRTFLQNHSVMHSQTMLRSQQYQQQQQQYQQQSTQFQQDLNQNTLPNTSNHNASDHYQYQPTIFTGHSNINQGQPHMNQSNYRQNAHFRKSMTILPFSIDEETLLWGFERQKDYQYYFPYYNCQNVLRRIVIYQQKNARLRRQKNSKKINSDGVKKKQKILSSMNLAKTTQISKAQSPEKLLTKQSNEFSLNMASIELTNKIEKSSFLPLVSKDNGKELEEIFKIQEDKTTKKE